MAKIFEGCLKFESEWESGKRETAIDIYKEIGKPFWYAEMVGKYYERCGLASRAMAEYEMLIGAYEKMGMLPLPRGPIELYKLGKWYVERNPSRAKRYLALYIRAEKEDSGTGFGIKHKKEAQYLLNKLN